MAAAGIRAAALACDQVLLLDRPAVLARARQLDIALFGYG
jgi:hypothetical protein